MRNNNRNSSQFDTGFMGGFRFPNPNKERMKKNDKPSPARDLNDEEFMEYVSYLGRRNAEYIKSIVRSESE